MSQPEGPAVICPDCRTRFAGEDGYVPGEPCPVCWVTVGGVLEEAP